MPSPLGEGGPLAVDEGKFSVFDFLFIIRQPSASLNGD